MKKGEREKKREIFYRRECFVNKIRRQNSFTGRARRTHGRESSNADMCTSVYTRRTSDTILS